MNLIAQIGGYSVLALALITIVCIAFAERNAVPMEDDQFTPELPYPGPVVLPPPIFQDKAMRDRFNDLDCRTDFDVCQGAKRLRDRSEKAWLN